MHRDKVAANVAPLVGRSRRNDREKGRARRRKKPRKKGPARWRKSHLLGMTSDCSDKGTTILCNPDQASYVYIYIYIYTVCIRIQGITAIVLLLE